MGPYKPPNLKNGFVILNWMGSIYDRTLFQDEQKALQSLEEKGFRLSDGFKIVPAHFEIDKAELSLEEES